MKIKKSRFLVVVVVGGAVAVVGGVETVENYNFSKQRKKLFMCNGGEKARNFLRKSYGNDVEKSEFTRIFSTFYELPPWKAWVLKVEKV